ncbi:MAG: transcriptional regulator [Alphaproteobacteria bacterium HGW-Alphaproteobacteria-13]|nr:MAG: transcriptional regulator [Alphaproteobacteria bacterium HGW-Alphaproteobacteria-13]
MTLRYLSSRQLKAALGGVSDMSIWRWQTDPSNGFPKPVRIGRRRFWRADEVERWMADR